MFGDDQQGAAGGFRAESAFGALRVGDVAE